MLQFTPYTHMHPYVEGFDDDVYFYIKIDNVNKQKSDPSNYKMKLMTNPSLTPDRHRKIIDNKNTEGNVNLFKLNEIYPSHLDVVGELIVKCNKYISWYSGPFLKLFGLSKMTKDVIRQVLPEFMK